MGRAYCESAALLYSFVALVELERMLHSRLEDPSSIYLLPHIYMSIPLASSTGPLLEQIAVGLGSVKLVNGLIAVHSYTNYLNHSSGLSDT